MEIKAKLPDKLLSEIWLERVLFSACPDWLNIISFIFAIFCFVWYTILSYFSGGAILEILIVSIIVLFVFIWYHNSFKNKRYYVWTVTKLIIYKDNILDIKKWSDFSWNMEVISKSELNLELNEWELVKYDDWNSEYIHKSVYIYWIKSIYEIKNICKMNIKWNDSGNDELYNIKTILPSSIMNLIWKILIFVVLIIIYVLFAWFLVMIAVATYENYENFILWFVFLISIFILYYIYKIIF